MQEVISDTFVPALFGEDAPFPNYLTKLFSLPTSTGGLGIPDLREEAHEQYAASLSITSPHVESIIAQDQCLRDTNKDGESQAMLKNIQVSKKLIYQSKRSYCKYNGGFAHRFPGLYEAESRQRGKQLVKCNPS